MSEFGHLSSTSLTHSKTHTHLKREGLTTLMALHSPTVQSRQWVYVCTPDLHCPSAPWRDWHHITSAHRTIQPPKGTLVGSHLVVGPSLDFPLSPLWISSIFILKEFHMITAGCLPSPHRQQKELFIIHYSDTEPWLPDKDFSNLVWVLTMRCFFSVTLQANLSIVRQYELQDHLFECYSWLSWEVNANQHRCWSVLNFTWPISICLDQTNPSVMKMLKKTYHAAKAD